MPPHPTPTQAHRPGGDLKPWNFGLAFFDISEAMSSVCPFHPSSNPCPACFSTASLHPNPWNKSLHQAPVALKPSSHIPGSSPASSTYGATLLPHPSFISPLCLPPGGLGPTATYSSNSPASPLSSASLTSPLSPFSLVSGSQGSPTKPGSSEVS